MSNLCDLLFIFINHITSFKHTFLLFVHFLEYLLSFLDNNVDEEREQSSNSKSSASECCLVFSQFSANFSLALTSSYFLFFFLIFFFNNRYIEDLKAEGKESPQKQPQTLMQRVQCVNEIAD